MEMIRGGLLKEKSVLGAERMGKSTKELKKIMKENCEDQTILGFDSAARDRHVEFAYSECVWFAINRSSYGMPFARKDG